MSTKIAANAAHDDVTIKLSYDEFDTLLLALGYAAGAAHGQKQRRLFYSFIALSNAVNRDNPRFKPYEIPALESAK